MSQPHVPATRPAIPAGRDLTLDLARVACVLVVVFVHLVLVGVGRNPDGSPLIDSPVTGSRWVAPVSWVAEIMPLFFVVGGFAAKTGWESAQAEERAQAVSSDPVWHAWPVPRSRSTASSPWRFSWSR